MIARLRYNPRFMVSAILLAAVLVFALIGPLLPGRDPFKVVGGLFNSPSGAHWLGTDNFGHDVLSQLMAGTRTSLIIGVIAGAVATVIGVALGTAHHRAARARGAQPGVALDRHHAHRHCVGQPGGCRRGAARAAVRAGA